MRQNRSTSVVSVIIKTLLGLGVVAVTLKSDFTVKSFEHAVALIMVFVAIYDICSVFQYCLRLTGNYIVAVVSFFVFFYGAGYLYAIMIKKAESTNVHALEIICGICLVVVMTLPIVFDIKSVVRSRKND